MSLEGAKFTHIPPFSILAFNCVSVSRLKVWMVSTILHKLENLRGRKALGLTFDPLPLLCKAQPKLAIRTHVEKPWICRNAFRCSELRNNLTCRDDIEQRIQQQSSWGKTGGKKNTGTQLHGIAYMRTNPGESDWLCSFSGFLQCLQGGWGRLSPVFSVNVMCNSIFP